MYGDEYLNDVKKITGFDRTKCPESNRDICNPLFRVHNNEWTHDKNERGLNKTQNKKKEESILKLPIHEIEAKLKLIQQIHRLRELKQYGTNRTTNPEGAVSD